MANPVLGTLAGAGRILAPINAVLSATLGVEIAPVRAAVGATAVYYVQQMAQAGLDAAKLIERVTGDPAVAQALSEAIAQAGTSATWWIAPMLAALALGVRRVRPE